MEKNLFLFVSLLGLLSCGNSSSATGLNSSMSIPDIPGLIFTLENGTYAVSWDGDTAIEEVNVPESYLGVPVTAVSRDGFNGCRSLRKIALPSGLTHIRRDAFRDCVLLETANIPSSVKLIGRDAFFYCTSLKDLELPAGLTSLGLGAFEGCTSFTSITLPEGITSIEESVFSGCENLKEVILPSSVTSIAEYAFAECRKLESIVIPEATTTLGKNAFIYCESLKGVDIRGPIKTIGEGTFYFCEAMEWVVIPKSVTIIESYAFGDYTNPSAVFYGGDSKYWGAIDIGHANEGIASATVYYYSESSPAESGAYWRYVDGVPTPW